MKGVRAFMILMAVASLAAASLGKWQVAVHPISLAVPGLRFSHRLYGKIPAR